MNQFYLGEKSRANLDGVDQRLISLVEYAITITPVDFTVLEGVRSIEKQAEYVASGASNTMNSHHLTGHAVDLGALVNGALRWDWPLYDKIAMSMLCASQRLGIPVTWGGFWKSLKDGPHYQVPRE